MEPLAPEVGEPMVSVCGQLWNAMAWNSGLLCVISSTSKITRPL